MDLRERIAADTDRIRDDLERLVRLPSIAFAGFPREPLDAAAEVVADLLKEAGAAEVRAVEVPDEPPSVYAEFPGEGPTVLLYAHYDVQPAPPDGWESEPFEPQLRDGRLYGRGASDDKSGVVAHLAALRAWEGRPPVNVKVLIEGSEENGRQNLLHVVDREPDLLRADVMVICDGGNWKLGEPTLCESLRGHGKLTVTVRTLTRRAALRAVRRRRAGRAARAHARAGHAARRRRHGRRRRACRSSTGRAPTCRRPTSAARPACSTASR